MYLVIESCLDRGCLGKNGDTFRTEMDFGVTQQDVEEAENCWPKIN